ncbi:MAG: hypothetical protein ABI024_14620 [Vicinamibacterales bacterium]
MDTLVQADAKLSRSFAVCVVAVLAMICWMIFVATPDPEATTSISTGGVGLVLLVIQFACYVWYAVAAGGAAKALGEPGWKYVLWILAAPFLAFLPIPIVSTVIAVSPLSIKFLLGSQLQSAIRQESNIHQSA